MTNLNINKILNDFPSFEDHILEQLQDNDIQKEYLRLNLEDYAKSGEYTLFLKAL